MNNENRTIALAARVVALPVEAVIGMIGCQSTLFLFIAELRTQIDHEPQANLTSSIRALHNGFAQGDNPA